MGGVAGNGFCLLVFGLVRVSEQHAMHSLVCFEVALFGRGTSLQARLSS